MQNSWINDLIQYIANTTIEICTRSGLEIYKAYRRQQFETFGNDTFENLLLAAFDVLKPERLYRQLLEISTGTLEHLLYLILVYFMVCLTTYILLHRSRNFKRACLPWAIGLRETRRILIVIAHPDDECMFFGPFIYTLTQRTNCPVYILCLSSGTIIDIQIIMKQITPIHKLIFMFSGNYENLGEHRREELWKSCAQLGVPDSHIVLVKATKLPDDPHSAWRPDIVANLILHAIETLDIKMLVTFDPDGVSGHANHCAIYYAAASLHMANLLPKGKDFIKQYQHYKDDAQLNLMFFLSSPTLAPEIVIKCI